MSDLVTSTLTDGIAHVRMDDGKVNALSSEMLRAVRRALDQAEADGAVVVLTGRAQTFSAGFDLRSQDWRTMLVDGAELAERLLSFPAPVVAACNGNALAMAAFLLLSCDVRIGVEGSHKIGLNEVAIGLTMPWFGLAIAEHRLTRPAFDRCTTTGVILDPPAAAAAGFLDRVVPAEALEDAALAAARELAAIDRDAHVATKLRARERVLTRVRESAEHIAAKDGDW